MAQNTVWILGGGTVIAAITVAVLVGLGMREPAAVPATPARLAVQPATPGAGLEARTEASPVAPASPPASPPANPGAIVAASAAAGEPAGAAVSGVLPAAVVPEPPTFDVVRIARDGAALVAGSALPGAAVTLRVDGQSVAETAADSSGQFVAMFDLGASDAVQVMTLDMQGADGAPVPADATVILTPRPDEAPVALAAAAVEGGGCGARRAGRRRRARRNGRCHSRCRGGRGGVG